MKEKVIFKRGFSSNSNSKPQQWELQISAWKVALGATGLLSDLEPWTTMPRLRLAGVSPTTRVKEILNCVCMEILGGAYVTQELMKKQNFHRLVRKQMAGVVCDLSQNPHRRAFTNVDCISKCMTTSSILYSFQHDRVILPVEMMLIQGHRENLRIPVSLSPGQLHDLAAMGISLPNLATLVLGIWLQFGF